MIAAEHIEAWRGSQVLDPNGEQLGKLEEVYLDAQTQEPVLVAVKSGLLGRHQHLVPLNNATVGPDFVRVAHLSEVVEGASGAADEGAPGHAALRSLGELYGLRFKDGMELASAGDIEARRAAAEQARERAEELEAEAREKQLRHDEARERAQGAGDDAGRAEQEAEDARRAAEQARAEAERHGGQEGVE